MNQRVPDIDLSRCSACQGCQQLCPGIFRLHPAGYMEVLEQPGYPEEDVNEAIAKCPEDCLTWRTKESHGRP